MPDDQKTKLRVEIANVLFIDIVGYFKLLIDEQSEGLHELNPDRVQRRRPAERKSELSGRRGGIESNQPHLRLFLHMTDAGLV